MAELTVPSRKRRALAELLMSQQPTQPQMVGNQMVYSPTAGLLSGIAQGVGGYLKGQEAEAADNQDKLRREELSKYLSPAQEAQYGDIKFSGGAPELAGIAESGIPSAPVTQPARPASFDYQSAIADALLRGDTESVGTYANASKAFAGGDEYGEAKNIFLPETGKITAAQISKGGNVRQLPFALYQPQNEVFDPLSNRLIKTGGLDPSMVRGYTPLAEQTRTVPLGAEKTPQQKAAEDAAASRVRAEQREERRLAIAEKTAGEKDVERAKKMKGAQVNYEIGERLLNELEAQIKNTDTQRLINPTTKENAKAKSIATQLGDIYRSKEFADLGVINPADVPRIEAVVADPTSLMGAAQGKESQLERIKQMRQMLKDRRHIIYGEQERPKLRYE